MRYLLITLVILICMTGYLPAYQQMMGILGQKGQATTSTGGFWTSILSPSRGIAWNTAGVQGGIPRWTSPPCQTIAPTGIQNWQASHAYNAGDQISDANGNLQQAVITASSGAISTDLSHNRAFWPTTPLNTQKSEGAGLVTWQLIDNLRRTDGNEINYWLRQCNGNNPLGDGTTGSVVQLTAGTYYVTGGLAFNRNPSGNFTLPIDHVVLRGQGPLSTNVILTNVGQCAQGDICMQGSYGFLDTYFNPAQPTLYAGNAGDWNGADTLGSYAQGASLIITSNWATTNNMPIVGYMLYLDQNADQGNICQLASYPAGLPSGTGACAPGGTAIYGATQSGNTVTIHTRSPHELSVNDCVLVSQVNGDQIGAAYNSAGNSQGFCPQINANRGWWLVTAVPDQYTFQYTAPVSGWASLGGGAFSKDTGGTYYSDLFINSATTALEGRVCPAGGNAPLTASQCTTGEAFRRAVMEPKLITAVFQGGQGSCPSGYTCFQVTPPLIMPNFRSQKRPGVWWTGPLMNNYDGVEDMTLDARIDANASTAQSGGGSAGTVFMRNSINSWVRNVRGLYHTRNFLWIQLGMHNSAVDNYIYGAKGNGSTSYVFERGTYASMNLVQNNICEAAIGCFLTQDGAIGNVVGYNYSLSNTYTLNSDALGVSLIHNHGDAWFNLAEGNNVHHINADNLHGSGGFNVSFRNRMRGMDYPFNGGRAQAADVIALNRAYSYVGNVLGWNNQPWGIAQGALWYQDRVVGQTQRVKTAIWGLIGLNGAFAGGPTGLPPGSASSTVFNRDDIGSGSLMRWGNYDVITGTDRWCSGVGSDPKCSGVLSATFLSKDGAAFTGSVPEACPLQFIDPAGIGQGAWGAVYFTAQNVIDTNIRISAYGWGYDPNNPPTTATVPSSGGQLLQGTYTTNCPAGTIHVQSTVGQYSEVPTTDFTFMPGNFIPANHTLPSSFYLTSQPSFWTMVSPLITVPFPAVGPDVNASGAADTSCTDKYWPACDGEGAHHAYQIPAQQCYNSLQPDPAYVQTFTPVTNGIWTANLQNDPNLPTGTTFVNNTTLTVNNTLTSYVSGNSTVNPLVVEVSGVNPPSFNGRFRLRAATPTSLYYLQMVDPTAGNTTPYVSGGTVKAYLIRAYDARNCYANEL